MVGRYQNTTVSTGFIKSKFKIGGNSKDCTKLKIKRLHEIKISVPIKEVILECILVDLFADCLAAFKLWWWSSVVAI